jgi:carboxypeptidase T
VKRFNHLKKISCILLIVFTLQISGCVESEEQFRRPDIDLHFSYWVDQPSILPNWTDDNYHDYYETTSTIFDYQTKFPQLVDIFTIGTSVAGKNIWCMKITNEVTTNQKYSCLIDGCIHGSEWEAGEACLYLAEYLLINFGWNHTVTQILNTTDIYIVPNVNPDGRQKDYRFNDHGIDLNRNFDVHFGRLRGHSIPLGMLFGRIKIPRIDVPYFGFLTNSGRRPFSEPETRALRDLMFDLETERFSFYITCHTATHQVLPPWSTFKPIFQKTDQEKSVFNQVMEWIVENTEYEDSPLGYKASGTSLDWCFKEFRIPCFTFELLSLDYEPRSGGGRHDHLVHWMKTGLPVFLYLLVNIKDLKDWDNPSTNPPLPEGVPPKPI